jgi:YidC/Oxa1 family membrane protein insertase
VERAAVQTRYFLGAIAVKNADARGVTTSAAKRPLSAEDRARLGPRSKPEQDVAQVSLISALPGRERPVHSYVVYFGPAEYFRLSALGSQLERAVDMGWNWILPFSKALLSLLNWLYSVVRNYGVAIVLLATVVRVALHPLNVAGMRSMRAMQKLQPEMERIREKYKNDPQAMNSATMALYKEHKVNPASGCLPMLLQMPLFLALYQVLFNAIELRRAPFVAWMQDLSAPDTAFTVAGFPIRLLPILMTVSGLLQQMATPTDPRQRTTMYMMNVVMLVFFYSLPSGLVLYWTVMNLLTALQQWLVLRNEPAPVPVAVPVKAAAPPGKRRNR